MDAVTYIDVNHAFDQVLAVTDETTVIIASTDGEVLVSILDPPPGTNYVGNRRPRGPRHTRGGRTVTKVLIHPVSPMS